MLDKICKWLAKVICPYVRHNHALFNACAWRSWNCFVVSFISAVSVVSVLKCSLVCPMYTFSRALHFAPQAPLFSHMFYFSVWCGGFLPIVLFTFYVMFRSVFLKMLEIWVLRILPV